MNREILVKRITKILSYIDDKNLAMALRENEKLFSEKELGDLLGFLESGDYSLLYELLQEKIEEYKGIVKEIQILRGKVSMEKIGKKEQEEKEQEEKEVEQLLSF